MIDELRGRQRLFAVEAASLSAPMTSVHVDHSVLCQLTQPQVKRNSRISKIVLQSRVRFDQHVLHDVTGVNALSDFAIEPQLNHLA